MKKITVLATLMMAATGAMAQPPPPPLPGQGAPFDIVAGIILLASIGYATYVMTKRAKA